MDAPETYLRAMFATQVGLALLGAYRAHIARDQLNTYASKSSKMSEWSKEAQSQVSRTRKIWFRSVLILLASLLAATALAIFVPILPTWIRVGGSPAMLVLTLIGRAQIKDISTAGAKTDARPKYLPNVGDFATPQASMEDLVQVAEFLEYGWVATSFIAAMLG